MGAFNLLSFVTGKVSLWIMAGLVAVVIGMWGWVYLLKTDIKVEQAKLKVEQAERREIENALTLQSSLIDANRASYETNLKSANTAALKVKIEYKTKI